jgi:hypothetical protein
MVFLAKITTEWRRSAAAVSALVLVPIVLQVVFTVAAKYLEHAVPWYGNFRSQAISTVVGLLLLVERFRWRALILALVYGPLMFGLLIYLSVVFAGIVLGDPL